MHNTLSIIVPVYNTAEFLPRCIDSIIGQSYSDIEVLLVDDGSTDGSGEICDQYEKKDSRIKVFHQKNAGQSAARNMGIDRSNGKFLTFIDSDDWIDPEMYEVMMDNMLEHDLGIVECDLVWRYDEKKKEKHTIKKAIVQDRLTALKRIVEKQEFSVCTRIYDRSLIGDIRFPVGKFAEDVYFTVDYMVNVNSLAVLENKFYNYYKANDSTTRGAFSVKSMGTMDAAFYLQEKLRNHTPYSPEIEKAVNDFLLAILLYNYKSLHHYTEIDQDKGYRKDIRAKMKKIMGYKKYKSSLMLARWLPLNWYQFLLNLNKQLKRS